MTQTCTVQRGAESFDIEGGCTLVIDPYGGIRYAVFKKLDSEDRQKGRPFEVVCVHSEAHLSLLEISCG